MFKNFLTYNFAVRFHQSCCSLNFGKHAIRPVQNQIKNDLIRCSENILVHLSKSIRVADPKEELKFLCVALMYLRECKEIILQMGGLQPDMMSEFKVLHDRLERLCLKASNTEDGQLRMFG